MGRLLAVESAESRDAEAVRRGGQELQRMAGLAAPDGRDGPGIPGEIARSLQPNTSRTSSRPSTFTWSRGASKLSRDGRLKKSLGIRSSSRQMNMRPSLL